MFKLIVALSLLGTLLNQAAQAAEIRIICGAAPAENIFAKIKDKFETKTGIKIVYVMDVMKTPADQTLAYVVDGKADVGAAAIPWPDWMKLGLEKKAATQEALAAVTQRVIGRDIIKVFANTGNGVSELKLGALARVFSGEITNWKVLNGKDLGTTVVLQKTYPATNAFFKKAVLGTKEFSATAVQTESVSLLIEMVRQTPGAIGFVSNQVETPNLVEIKTETQIGRPITAITKGKPSSDVLKLFDFIAGERL